jgi:hypothetical protein
MSSLGSTVADDTQFIRVKPAQEATSQLAGMVKDYQPFGGNSGAQLLHFHEPNSMNPDSIE